MLSGIECWLMQKYSKADVSLDYITTRPAFRVVRFGSALVESAPAVLARGVCALFR